MEETMPVRRLRVVFDDRHLLSKSRRSEGLTRCWVLLSPGLATVADLASHLTRTLAIRRASPSDLLLSMDGFVLPLFESTCIFKDKDIIRVRRKNHIVKEVIETGNHGYYIQDPENLEQQTILTSKKILAIEEFQENSRGYKSKAEDGAYAINDHTALMKSLPCENANSQRKRKQFEILQDSKRKKLKLASVEKPDITNKDAEKNHIEHYQSSEKRMTILKNSCKKDKPSNNDVRSDTLMASQVGDVGNTLDSLPMEERRKKSKSSSLEHLDGTTEDVENNHIQQSITALKSSRREDKSLKVDISDTVVVSEADIVNKAPAPRKHKRKEKSTTLEERDCRTEGAESNHTKQTITALESSHTKDKPSKRDRLDVSDASQAVISVEKRATRKQRHDEDLTNCKLVACEPQVNGVDKKLPSRSARRKKAKRHWRREMAASQPKEHTENEILPANNIHRKSPEHQKTDQSNETEDVIVPTIVRPGHIRFEPLDAEQSKQHSNGQVELLQWSGTTSKKKGQKWGREMTSRTNDDSCAEDTNGEFIGEAGNHLQHHTNGEFMAGDGNHLQHHTNGKFIAGDGDHLQHQHDDASAMKCQNQIDFDSLFPLSRLPKEGDVIAYRIVELSSSWCPELSTFRVGKVASYDPISMRIVLAPVPEHPFFPGEEIDEWQPDVSAYKDDGSLEIDYPSLVDVRLLKVNLSEEIAVNTLQRETAKEATRVSNSEVTSGDNGVKEKAGPVNNWELASANNNREKAVSPMCTVNNGEAASANNNITKEHDTPKEKRPDGSWEQINQALSEKKAQLLNNGGWGTWNPNKDTATPPWSYRILRRSAVGPTMAYLRSKKGKGA